MEWLEEQYPRTFRVRCKDCTQFFMCPCGKKGFCVAYEDYNAADFIVTAHCDCDYFEPQPWFDEDWDKTEPEYIPTWELEERDS